MQKANVFRHHDHSSCINAALDTAHQICQARKVRLTPTRYQVLKHIWQSHQPIGAYDLLAKLSQDGRSAAPPTVYRALNFLLEQGLIHRLDSLNAYSGCVCPEEGHQGCFLICRQCQKVQETVVPALSREARAAAAAVHFQPEKITMEISGLCPKCQSHD